MLSIDKEIQPSEPFKEYRKRLDSWTVKKEDLKQKMTKMLEEVEDEPTPPTFKRKTKDNKFCFVTYFDRTSPDLLEFRVEENRGGKLREDWYSGSFVRIPIAEIPTLIGILKYYE
jgi:hypothetical protein